MSREFSWCAPLWQADLDAFGELRTTSLLRLLQEAATRASSDAGFDSAYYERTGTRWIIRRTTLTLVGSVRYGDDLTVRTWIADFRRVRSQRQYEVHAGDRLIARAATDWVFVNRTDGRPRRIPNEWQSAFRLDGSTPSERVPFSEAEPPAQAMTRHRCIELHELDALRHVNNANYVAYVEQAAFDLAQLVGFDIDSQIAAGGYLRAVHHDLEYLEAALFRDEIAVSVWALDVTADHVDLHTHLHRGDARRPLLQARSRYQWTRDGVNRPLPDRLRAALRKP